MTPAELDALEALVNAATPLPWRQGSYGILSADHEGVFSPHYGWAEGNPRSPEDVEYIIAACNALPALVARVRELEADAKLGAKVREAIAPMDPESRTDRLQKIADGYDVDLWAHAIVSAIAEALREEAP